MTPCKNENVSLEASLLPKLVAPQADPWTFRIAYSNVLLFSYYHAAGLYGLYLCFTSARWATVLFAAILLEASILGTFAGAHRLWAHRSYKAKLPLELIFLVLQTLSGQYSVYGWVREHRQHHRHADTDADPHNASRGFFFSHIGWSLVHKHPEVIRRGASTDMSDINKMTPCKNENVSLEASLLPKLVAPQADPWTFRIAYSNVLLFSYYHAAGLYGLYLCFTSARWATVLFAAILLEASILGTFAGAHRLWAHRSYKAKLPLELIFLVLQTLSGQYSVYGWVREHRQHHRHADTDADPHNASRGFFFSHIGWSLVHKHPEVIRRGASTDMSDIVSNPLLAFQKRHAFILFTLICCVIPTAIPMYFWGETFNNAWNVNIMRFILCLSFTSLINSAAHTFGNRPYDKNVVATQNLAVSLCTLGEGFHNYHHTFPRDYRAGELGDWFNFSKNFIDFFEWIGWAYDLKTVNKQSIINKAMKSGDGTYTWISEDETLTEEKVKSPAT